MAENGYKPFVVIRPENEASQSLYKKLGFHKLYTIVRMTFVPNSWREPNGEKSLEENSVLRDEIVNAVQKLSMTTHTNDEGKEGEGFSITRVEEVLEPIPEECCNSDRVETDKPTENGKDL